MKSNRFKLLPAAMCRYGSGPIEPMQKNQINPTVIQDLFESAPNAADKGQAQYFTPLSWGQILSLPLPAFRPNITDLTCGNGQLLEAANSKSKLLGCDIEPLVFNGCNTVPADITKFYPLLREANWFGDLFVLNFPWDHHWYRDRLMKLAESDCGAVAEAFLEHDGRMSSDTIDSTVAGLCMALDRMSHNGEGFLIANESTLQRLIFGADAPHRALAQHVWAHLVIKGNICVKDGGKYMDSGVIYFARAAQPKCFTAQCATMDEAKRICEKLKNDRLLLRRGHGPNEFSFQRDARELWDAAAEEWQRLSTKTLPLYNIEWDVCAGRIRTALSLFDNASGRVDKDLAARLFELNGKQPIQLVVQRAQRIALELAVALDSPWRVDPALQAVVADAIVQYNAVRSPLKPLDKIQRLGYLDEQDKIKCLKSLGRFTEGESYSLRSITVGVRRNGKKINLWGLPDSVEWSGQELAFFITNPNGKECCFMDGRLREKNITVNLLRPGRGDKMVPDDDYKCLIDFTLQQLVDHFEIPEAPDVASLRPEQYQKNLQTISEILALVNALLPPDLRWKLKPFQIEDYARAAMHDGMILGHDTGLGKTIAAIMWSLLKVGFNVLPTGIEPKQPVLLVVPGDGHQQTAEEVWNRFRLKLVPLDSHAAFLRLAKSNAASARYELPAAFYITSYTQLSGNGVAAFPELDRKNPEATMKALNLREAWAIDWFNRRDAIYRRFYDRLEAEPANTWAELEKKHAALSRGTQGAYRDSLAEAIHLLKKVNPRLGGGWGDLDNSQQTFIKSEVAIQYHAEFSDGIGERKGAINCIYSPSLADLSGDSFGAIGVDEGTKIKGEDTIVSLGVRQINAPYRLVLTATPIKNRFPDVFRLAHYVCGGHDGPTPRFPYGDDGRDDFAEEFLVSEKNLSQEKEGRGARSKKTPQVCNIHRAWKLLAPIILRRRKQDCGEQIVPKHRHVIRVPMGLYQAAVYQYHIKAKYRDLNGYPAPGAKLQALRVAAANPASGLLKRPENDATEGTICSRYSYIPKVATSLNLLTQCLARGEQAIVFSAFQDSLDALSQRLNEAGVRHLVLDGRTSQKRRGELAKQFKAGPPRAVREGLIQRASPFPFLLAGIECMAELHSFHLCNNGILMNYSWAYDKLEQGGNRFHRLNSPWPVNMWSIVCEGSVDIKLEANLHEKGDAAGLILDGALPGDFTQEVNYAELLQIAEQEFKNIKTVDELDLMNDWPKVRAALGRAFLNWQRGIASADQSAPLENLPLWRARLR